MSKVATFPPGTKERMEVLLKQAKTAMDLRRVQCVLLGSMKIQSQDIAALVGYQFKWVKEVWIRFRKKGETALFGTRGIGNRNRALLPIEDEDDFIEPYLEQASRGGILIVREIHKSYEEQFKRKVNHSVIYRLLYRHGWRKIAPRPSHPHTDIVAQNIFKASFPPQGLGRKYRSRGKKSFFKNHVSR